MPVHIQPQQHQSAMMDAPVNKSYFHGGNAFRPVTADESAWKWQQPPPTKPNPMRMSYAPAKADPVLQDQPISFSAEADEYPQVSETPLSDSVNRKSRRAKGQTLTEIDRSGVHKLPHYFSEMLRPFADANQPKKPVEIEDDEDSTSSSSNGHVRDDSKRVYAENPIKSYRSMIQRSKAALVHLPQQDGRVAYTENFRSSDRPLNFREKKSLEEIPPLPPRKRDVSDSAAANPLSKSFFDAGLAPNAGVDPSTDAKRTKKRSPKPTADPSASTTKLAAQQRERPSAAAQTVAIQPTFNSDKDKTEYILKQPLFRNVFIKDKFGQPLQGEKWQKWKKGKILTVGDVFSTSPDKINYDVIYTTFPPTKNPDVNPELEIICAAIPIEWRDLLWRNASHK